jgi:predicted small lipoprotein YifL
MKARVCLMLLVLVLACGKKGPPLRHPPQPRQAGSAAATQPAPQDPSPAAPEVPASEATDPAAPATEDTQP